MFSQEIPLISDCVAFGDCLETGVHEAGIKNTYATDSGRAKVRMEQHTNLPKPISLTRTKSHSTTRHQSQQISLLPNPS